MPHNSLGVSDLLRIAALATLYFLFAKLSWFFPDSSGFPLVWLPLAVAVSALLRFGKRLWPGVLLGAAVSAVALGLAPEAALREVFMNTLEPVLGMRLLSRCGFQRAILSLRDYFRLVLLTAAVTPLILTLLEAGTQHLLQEEINAAWAVRLWGKWMGHCLGALLIAPLLVWMHGDPPPLRGKSLVEAVFLMLIGGYGCAWLFLGWGEEFMSFQARGFLLFPVLLWSALSFGRHGVALVCLTAMGLGLYGDAHGLGYFGADQKSSGISNFWLYQLVFNLVGMTLAIAMRERRDFLQKLEAERIQLHKNEQRAWASNRVLQQISSGIPLPSLMETIALDLEAEVPGLLCCILLKDEEGLRFSLGTAPSLPEFFSRAPEWTMDPELFHERAIVADLQQHPFWAPSIHLAQRAGLTSCWLEPIRSSQGKLLGGFIFYRRAGADPGDLDPGIVEQAAQLARLAIERKRAEADIQLAASVYQAVSEAIVVTDVQHRIIAVNAAFSQLTGYSAAEVMYQNPKMLSGNFHPESFYQSSWQDIQTIGRWQGEVWTRRKNGEAFAGWMSINLVRDDQGNPHRHVLMLTDISEKKQADELIWRQANYDALTDLPNRRLFRDRLQSDLKKTRRSAQLLALMLIDLDHFKEVNDTLGHDVGDLLLLEAVRRIASCVRETDTLARLGGDEFTVVLPQILDPERAENVAREILRSLAEPFQLGTELASVSASIGITVFPDDAEDMETLIKFADQAMFEAKSRGRNGYCRFTQALQQAGQQRASIMRDLRNGFAQHQFEIAYQPMVNLRDGSITKVEALLRWHHPTRGLILPSEFISVAEEIGLIGELGDWVFQQAAHEAQHLRNLGHPIQIAINKSVRQFLCGDTVNSWLEHLRQNELSPSHFNIEITESSLLDERLEVREKLRQFRGAGVEITIDDFGTGYSSLACLKHFELDYLKIDQEFIRDLTLDPNDLALSEAIIVMAHRLGLKVIAEGVETRAQHDLLVQAGCDYGQGHFFSSPLSPRDLERLLVKSTSLL